MMLRHSRHKLSKVTIWRKWSGIAIREKSLENKELFWSEAAKDIDWVSTQSSSETILDQSKSPFNRWFPSRTLNTCHNCIDRHVNNGKGNQVALIYDSPVTNTIRHIAYEELLSLVSSFSALLIDCGAKVGDRVIIYMPNIPECAIAMLACARIGAVHSVVFGGFAPNELATRIKDSKPTVIVAASCGVNGKQVIAYKPLLDKALEMVKDDHVVDKCIIMQRPMCRASMERGRDVDWAQGMRAVEGRATVPCQPVQSTDPLYILYTSGTTGAPKGVVRDNGGHAVALKWTMKNFYGMNPGDVFWAASDVGWVVGHSYSVYGPLLQGCASVLYEGKPVGTPDESQFWRVIERHKVNALFTAPTALKAIKQLDSDGLTPREFDLSSLRTVFLAGERANPATIKWAEHALNIPIRDHWWQTETGWPICGNLVGAEGYQPIKYGSTSRPCPGYDIRVLDDAHNEVPAGTVGTLAIKLPLPPGFMLTLYNSDERFVQAYMKAVPGYYDTGDAGLVDEDGCVFVMSRTDDVINVAGHRLSSGAMEEVLMDHHDVAEVAVVGVRNSFKGQVPLGLLVLNAHCTRTEDEVTREVVQMVRNRIGPVAAFKKAVVVARLPKTRSGKILRAVIRSMANGDSYNIPSTVEDPASIDEIAAVIKAHEEEEA